MSNNTLFGLWFVGVFVVFVVVCVVLALRDQGSSDLGNE